MEKSVEEVSASTESLQSSLLNTKSCMSYLIELVIKTFVTYTPAPWKEVTSYILIGTLKPLVATVPSTTPHVGSSTRSLSVQDAEWPPPMSDANMFNLASSTRS